MKKHLPQYVAAVVFIGLVVVALTIGYGLDWTGFGRRTLANGEIENAKTLWDWMELILVPVILFLVARFFTIGQQRIEEERTLLQQQDLMLQHYLDRMQDLILEKDLVGSGERSPVAKVARTLTLVTLKRLIPSHRGSVIQFLDEARLIQDDEQNNRILSLAGADLEGIGGELGIAFCDFAGADLRGANLQNCKLDFTNFEGANLQNAVLEGASIIGANFRGANLHIALLQGANLYGSEFDENTVLPNGKPWSDTDIRIFGAVMKAPYSERDYEKTMKELHAD